MRRALALVLLMVVAAGVAYLLMRTVARTEVTDVVSVPAPIGQVSVSAAAGSVAVDAGPDDVLTARITKGYAFITPDVATSATGGRVALDTGCPALGALTGCSVDVAVVTPPAAAVRATSTGGPVMVTGITGAVVARSTAGGVAVLRSGAADVRASSTGGDVRVECDRAPTRVEATATDGDVTVVVPRGAYRIDAAAGTGSVDLQGVDDVRSSGRVIVVGATSGGVTIRGR